MTASILILCAAAAFSGREVPSPVYDIVARVNDPASHGQVGDGLLSLQEAIRLHNGTLTLGQLSAAETSQLVLISGPGGADVSTIEIDGSAVPVLVVQQDLDAIAETGSSFTIRGVLGAPILDFSGAGIHHGFRVVADAARFENLTLAGGPYGIDVTQVDTTGTSGLDVAGVRFPGQSQFGLRVTGNGVGGAGDTTVVGSRFENVPQALVHAEPAASRTSALTATALTMRNVGTGIHSTLGDGGNAHYDLARCDIESTGTAVRLVRPVGANRPAVIAATQLRLRGSAGLQIDITSQAYSDLALRMLDIAATGIALSTTAGNQTFGILEDSTIIGAATIGTAYAPAPLAVRNVQFRGGQVVFSAATGGLQLTAARFVGSAVVVLNGTVQALGCSLEGGSFQTAANAGLTCQSCFAPTPASGLTIVNPLPAAALGSMSLQPETVALGTTVQLQADLPSGLFGAFLLGFTDPAPQLLPAPLHVYSMPTATFLLPGVFRFQQAYPWTIPNQAAFAGLDLTAHIAVLPDPNVVAPALHIPPGRRFVLQ